MQLAAVERSTACPPAQGTARYTFPLRLQSSLIRNLLITKLASLQFIDYKAHLIHNLLITKLASLQFIIYKAHIIHNLLITKLASLQFIDIQSSSNPQLIDYKAR